MINPRLSASKDGYAESDIVYEITRHSGFNLFFRIFLISQFPHIFTISQLMEGNSRNLDQYL